MITIPYVSQHKIFLLSDNTFKNKLQSVVKYLTLFPILPLLHKVHVVLFTFSQYV